MKTDTHSIKIGGRIREAREKAGMSQIELAKEIGYKSATAVSLIEAGERKVNTEVLQSIAETLHCEMAFFLGQEQRQFDIRVALRADKELSEEDKKAVLHFIELAKSRYAKR